MVFISAVIAALAIGALLVTDRVTRDGLEDLFRQRFERAQVVLEQYATAHHLSRVREIETVLTSPRFLAALETQDANTVAQEIPTHASILGSQFVVVEDPAGRLLFASREMDEELLRGVRDRLARATGPDVILSVLPNDSGVVEIVCATIEANNGAYLGRIASGASFASSFASDLERLTGFEILLTEESRTVGWSDSPVFASSRIGADDVLTLDPGRTTTIKIDGRSLLAYRVDDPTSGLAVSFLGSVDDSIRPIVTKVRILLFVLAVIGSATAIALLLGFTRRRVSAQVDHLVGYAERIAREDLDFEIAPATDDEFGWLARKLEEMRARLATSRRDLEHAHSDRLNAEKMAALGRVAAGIIHDFKSPMAVIRGTAEIIEARSQGNEKLARQCSTIRQQVDRMTSLTRDVLEYTSGKSFLEPTTVELGSFLEELRSFHADAFARAGVKLEMERSDSMHVLLDPGRMRRVLDNVVVNAREVSRVGDCVRVRGSAVAGDGVRIEISDEGPGIPADVLPRVFEPFVTSGKEGGTGLGLAIARKIVEDHGGVIEAKNLGARGARFTITLPEKLRIQDQERLVQESTA